MPIFFLNKNCNNSKKNNIQWYAYEFKYKNSFSFLMEKC